MPVGPLRNVGDALDRGPGAAVSLASPRKHPRAGKIAGGRRRAKLKLSGATSTTVSAAKDKAPGHVPKISTERRQTAFESCGAGFVACAGLAGPLLRDRPGGLSYRAAATMGRPQKRKLRSSWIERCNRGAPSARFRLRVAIVQNVRSAGEYFAHDLTLHSDTTAVDRTYCAKSQSSRLLLTGFHHPLHIARRYTVQIEHIADGNADGLVRIRKIVRHVYKLIRSFSVAAKYTLQGGTIPGIPPPVY